MDDRKRFERLLRVNLGQLADLSGRQIECLWEHYALMRRWSRVLNLTAIRTLDEAVRRHYCESLFVGLQLPLEPVSVLDIGSGAGFPGIPIAILRPDCCVALAESHQRKAAFLREATRSLHNVAVLAQRAEALSGSFDWLVSRAVRWRQVLPIAARLGHTVALLLGSDDIAAVRSVPAFQWRDPIAVPWSTRTYVLTGVRCSTWNVSARGAGF